MPDKTAEDFKVEDGKRWFYTGDIGMFHEDGVLQIIDRKKDLVKNQNGEYVSYGKIEPLMKDSPLVDNVMVYQDPNKNNCVALVTCETKPSKPSADEVAKSFADIGKVKKLAKFEIPTKVYVCDEGWNPDNDMATAAMKLKRNNIVNHYRAQLDTLYA
jgi:long-chain acyl-CoA synthetase